MICPKCGCDTKVCDTRNNEKDNEVLRQRICKVCFSRFFTVEFEAESNKDFIALWQSLAR